MRDTLIALLILALGVGWFSIYGPRELPEGREDSSWVMPGAGEGVEHVQAGEGTEPVTVTIPAPTEATWPETVETPGGESAWDAMPVTVTVEEVECMEPFLIGCVVGGALVLAGVFASPAAAWLWDKIHKK